ncbi:uncharacterized protein UTRI_03349_B [Ustilago trichophora]|uniref:Cyclase n=1 Tax=Ustilago trichophora TaxID=86804 RepID=A0A5C3E689_9BASI|nr:uncharacterized protein UTRI_03349_B [Ustilago trichophora]
MTVSASNGHTNGKGGTFAAGHLPDFDNIPAVPGMPHGCAWNVWGDGDELGTLNLLTPEVVARAAQENIRTGDRVQIDWGLDSVDVPANQRKHFHHEIIDLKKKLGVYATDDEVHLNTQTSSQWDGFNHFAHQSTAMYYGGVKHDDLHSGAIDKADRNSMHKWCLNGGIAGRGVLVDWVQWWESTKSADEPIPPANSSYPIPLSQIKEVLAWQGTQLRTGDILLLRTGVVRWFEQASDEEKVKGMIENDNFPGIEATEETKRWIWNSHFAAVGSDNMSFEFGPHGDLWLHEWMLPMYGCPIGELFDLERLSEACKKHQRYTFFLTSAPLRVKGGIASSPNAICIF